jgi:hypothetical protein
MNEQSKNVRDGIFQQTESYKASLKVLGERCKLRAEAIRKSIEEKESEIIPPEKTLEECLQTLTPVSPDSRLLSPTRSSRNNGFHKDEQIVSNSKHVKPLSISSHLLASTAASKHSAYQPPPKNSSRSSTPTRPVHVSERLTAFNASRRAAAFEKKVVEVDPREKGWDGTLTSPFNAHPPELSAVGSPGKDGKHKVSPSPIYRDVKSKLLKPTAASRHGQWTSSPVSSPCKASPDVVVRSPSPTRGSYRHVSSRLHKPTTASQACRYLTKEEQEAAAAASPSNQNASSPPRNSTPTVSRPRSASVTKKSTVAVRSAQRPKYEAVQDPHDIAIKTTKRPSSAPPGRGRPSPSTSETSSKAVSSGASTRAITQIRREVKALVDAMKDGKPYDHNQLSVLMTELHNHPLYSRQKLARCSAWRDKFMGQAQTCLHTMLGFVPPYDMSAESTTLETLVRDGLSPALAARMLSRKSLWVLRMDKALLLELSARELTELMNDALTDLDVVELSALFAAIPRSFHPTTDSATEKWHEAFERGIKQLLSQKHDGVLPAHRLRSPEYAAHTTPVYAASPSSKDHEDELLAVEAIEQLLLPSTSPTPPPTATKPLTSQKDGWCEEWVQSGHDETRDGDNEESVARGDIIIADTLPSSENGILHDDACDEN